MNINDSFIVSTINVQCIYSLAAYASQLLLLGEPVEAGASVGWAFVLSIDQNIDSSDECSVHYVLSIDQYLLQIESVLGGVLLRTHFV